MNYQFIVLFLVVLVVANVGLMIASSVSADDYTGEPGNSVAFLFFSTMTGEPSQGYGYTPFSRALYREDRHNGVDFAAPLGTPVHAAIGGKIILTGNQDDFCYRRGYGKFVVVEHDDGYYALYAHLNTVRVSTGDTLGNGARIGTVGKTGYATAPHLHVSIFRPNGFSIDAKNGCGPYPDGTDINPLTYLERNVDAE